MYIVSYLTKAKMSDFVYSGDHIKQAWLLAALIDILINNLTFELSIPFATYKNQ